MKETNDIIIYRYFVKGKLTLKSPLVLGCGENSNSDKDISRNWQGEVFIPSTSIAGAVRHYLDSILEKDSGEENKLIRQILGETEEDSKQSIITFYDGEGMENAVINIRDGVLIKPIYRVAEKHAKFNYEILEPGASCRFRIELIYRANPENSNNILEIENLLYLILMGFSTGDIRLGAKNARGFGEVKLSDLIILKLDMKEKEERLQWLEFTWDGFTSGNIQLNELRNNLLNIVQNKTNIKVEFIIPYSILIRSPNPNPNEEDVTHLSSMGKSVISGTSWTGALRNAIFEAARCLDKVDQANLIVEKLFGFAKTKKQEPNYEERAQKSRIFIKESIIQSNESHRQTMASYTHNKIDRFTGGTVDSALFTVKPSFGGVVILDITIFDAMKYEIGLVLLGIKELWHGLQPIGGTTNVGRGILSGSKLFIDDKEFTASDIDVGFTEILEDYLISLANKYNN